MIDVLNLIRTLAFGPFLVLAFFAGAFIFWKKGKEEYYDEHLLFDVLLSTAFWGFIGARLGFILVHFNEFGFDVLKWFSLMSYPGYLGFSGLLTGAYGMFMQTKTLRWDSFEIADFSAMAVALSTVVISIGMFVNGSGFGNATTLPIGLTFPGVFDKHHPTQLYAAIAYLGLFFLLWRLEGVYRTFLWYRENRRTAQTGFIFAIFCMGFGAIGLGLSAVQQGMIVAYGFSVDVVLYIASIIGGFVVLYNRSGRSFSFPKKKAPLHQAEQV
ncbi:MAG: prolipoprotein diacylglyceryl transferase [Candidatus Pacebacteria bacterium]|nr:prolipoprotein diacylglyceryl transferase [Candidatus Paceibacterota bacterium]